MTNFKSPYFSQSVKEFWSRWHISLSTWFRDYVYIPLGGNRVGKVRHAINLMITFLVSGLWHGANWTFVIWGGVHGAAQIIENSVIQKRYQKSKGIVWWLRVLAVFVFAAFAWIFFVSNTIGDAIYVIGHLFSGINNTNLYIHDGLAALGFGNVAFLTAVISIFILSIYDYLSLKIDVIKEIGQKNIIIRWGIYILLLLLIINFRATAETEFVYFQF